TVKIEWSTTKIYPFRFSRTPFPRNLPSFGILCLSSEAAADAVSREAVLLLAMSLEEHDLQLLLMLSLANRDTMAEMGTQTCAISELVLRSVAAGQFSLL
ncbi:hypothetical protein LINGRAHAP2_LOCUS8310, partial [Linum grandiflorum]